MTSKGAESMRRASSWAVSATGAPGKRCRPGYGFPAIRRNDSFRLVREGHLGSFGSWFFAASAMRRRGSARLPGKAPP